MNTATMLTGGKHGTKILGALGMVAAIMSAIDPSIIPPQYLPYYAGLAGLLTIARGFINTQNIETQSAMPTSTTNVGRAP